MFDDMTLDSRKSEKLTILTHHYKSQIVTDFKERERVFLTLLKPDMQSITLAGHGISPVGTLSDPRIG